MNLEMATLLKLKPGPENQKKETPANSKLKLLFLFQLKANNKLLYNPQTPENNVFS